MIKVNPEVTYQEILGFGGIIIFLGILVIKQMGERKVVGPDQGVQYFFSSGNILPVPG
jgi:hypothetical protein